MSENHSEPHNEKSAKNLNALRASVLGANDGIVSVAAIAVGVAAASSNIGTIFTAGLAGLVAGTMSMAAGEYVSVSSQKDTELALIKKEKAELRDNPDEEAQELAEIYQEKGLSKETADKVSQELMDHDPLRAHADAELGIQLDELTNPWQAAVASAFSFIAGGWVPLLAIVVTPKDWRIPVTFIAVVFALTITGVLSARAGGAGKTRAIARVVIGGAIAMTVTFFIGKIVGTTVS